MEYKKIVKNNSLVTEENYTKEQMDEIGGEKGLLNKKAKHKCSTCAGMLSCEKTLFDKKMISHGYNFITVGSQVLKYNPETGKFKLVEFTVSSCENYIKEEPVRKTRKEKERDLLEGTRNLLMQYMEAKDMNEAIELYTANIESEKIIRP